MAGRGTLLNGSEGLGKGKVRRSRLLRYQAKHAACCCAPRQVPGKCVDTTAHSRKAARAHRSAS